MTSTALYTDKYELTMLDAALRSGVAHRKATFEVFARKLPQGRRYGVVAGVQRVLDGIKNFRFTEEQIAYLREEGTLTEEALDYLANYKFSGNVTAYREGELFFPNSPVLTVDSTFAEAVLLETLILSIMNYDSAVAGAASRMVVAAKGRTVMELGARRANEDAAVAAARAAYICGFDGTSNMEAGMRYGIPVFGTAAHAFTLAHDSEEEAFRAQVAAFGPKTTLLVDTFDTTEGIKTAVKVAGPELGAIRIDSGDLRAETIAARELLDSLGATKTKIVVSSDLDEYAMDELLESGAPIDSFGVGTRLVTGSGNPTASMVYKLVAIEDEAGTMRPVSKNASGKISIGGRKMSWRELDSAGFAIRESVVVRKHDEYTGFDSPTTRALQVRFMEKGEQVVEHTMEQMRNHHRNALAELRDGDKAINSGIPALSA